MQQISFFIFKQLCFFKKCLSVAGFLQLGALYANILIPGVNIIGGKVSVVSVNGDGGSWGVQRPHGEGG